MGLSAEDLVRIDGTLGSLEGGAKVCADLRQLLPGLSVTRCDPEDLADETPFRTYPQFDLHLVDGSQHCWRLTADPAATTGLVVVVRKKGAK